MSQSPRNLRLAFLVPDNRDEHGRHSDPAPVFGPAPEALLQGFAKLPECEIHVVCCAKQPMPSPARIAENIYYHPLVVTQLGWMRTLYWGCVRAVRKKLVELQPEVVHGQGSERYCALAAAWSGFPNLVTLHGNMRSVARQLNARPFGHLWLTARLEHAAVRRAGGILCISTYTRRLVANCARRTWIVPNAVQEEFFNLEWRPVAPPRILCVADILPYKNQLAVIAALAPLAEKLPFELCFLGQAASGDAYARAFLAEISKHSWVRHEGRVARPRLKQLLAESTISILPTLEDNCPMVVLEAFAAGVPVIASQVGGVPDLIEDGVTGFLVNPKDADSIRERVGRLLEDKPLAQKLAAHARGAAFHRFRPEVIARRHLEVYRELLGLRQP